MAADLAKFATDLVLACSRRDFDAAYDNADKVFIAGFSEFVMAEMWTQVVHRAGTFKGVTGTKPYRHLLAPVRVVFVTCEFARTTVDVEVSFNEADKILGLAILAPGFA